MGCDFSSELKTTNFLVITANVGSLFENQEELEFNWFKALTETISKFSPDFVAIHCQEIGGKFYSDCERSVKRFVDKFSDLKVFESYSIQRGYVDEDVEHVDQYTALGSFYFIHEKLTEVEMFDFKEKKFRKMIGRKFHSTNLLEVSEIRKEKFKKDFFPECRWSRKGYIQTRWKIRNKILEFINIHLFHDENNLDSMTQQPSTYSSYRNRALKFVIEKLSSSSDVKNDPIYFLFGDLNFRLSMKPLLEKLFPTHNQLICKSENNQISKVVFRNHDNDDVTPCDELIDDKVALVIEKKTFDLKSKLSDESDSYHHLLEFDEELKLAENLVEFQIRFPPTYPYSENKDENDVYLTTRCPAWCDRVLLSPAAWKLLSNQEFEITYDRIGSEVCMGDHKPVFLNFNIS